MHPQPTPWRPIVALVAVLVATMVATSSVTIAPGDTLSALAAEHDVTVDQLVAWNDLDDPDRIVAGATLVVAAPDTGGGSSASADAVHVVTAGDTLTAIAARVGSTVARLVAANDLDDPDRIVEGQRLRLHGEAGSTAASDAASVATHTVASGDTLSAVARRYGVTVAALVAANGLDDPDRIRIGRLLTIGGPTAEPGPAGEPTQPTTPTPPTTAPPTTTVPVLDLAPPPTTVPSPSAGPRSQTLIVPLFAEWARVYRVPQDLLEAIAWHESDWRPDTVGPDGHLGIMQLSPAAVELIEGGLIGRDLDPLDPGDGIQMGARYLRYLLDRTMSEQEAVAAWAQGLRSVQGEGVSTAGAAYVAAVEEIRRQRR